MTTLSSPSQNQNQPPSSLAPPCFFTALSTHPLMPDFSSTACRSPLSSHASLRLIPSWNCATLSLESTILAVKRSPYVYAVGSCVGNCGVFDETPFSPV